MTFLQGDHLRPRGSPGMTLQAELALLSAFDMADIPVVSSMVATGLGPRVEKQTEGCHHYLELYGLTLSS